MQKLHDLIRKCRAIGESVFLTLVRYAFNRLRGVNLLQSGNCEIRGRENMEIGGVLQVGMDYQGFTHRRDRTLLNVRGKLECRSDFSIGKGCRIDIGPDAEVSLGKGYINGLTNLIISDRLTIGEGCAIAWGCELLDSDFHKIEYDGAVEKAGGITIGDNVWIGNGVTIARGANLPDGTVVAACSLVNKAFTEPNTLIGGVPAKVLRRGVSWS